MRYTKNSKEKGTHCIKKLHSRIQKRLFTSMMKKNESTKALPPSIAYPRPTFPSDAKNPAKKYQTNPQAKKDYDSLKENLHADMPNQKWYTDFTYLFLKNGGVRYNCIIMNLYDRNVVASITNQHITSDLTIRTLQKALDSQHLAKGSLILHNDQGSQYTSKAFHKVLRIRPGGPEHEQNWTLIRQRTNSEVLQPSEERMHQSA